MIVRYKNINFFSLTYNCVWFDIIIRRLDGRVVMQRPAKPLTPVRFRLQPPKWRTILCPGGGIGRHKGLKIPRRQLRAGSSPALGTKFCSC